MSNPLVSVIVPLYNYENYIRDCLRSILNQTYGNFEVIVCDDCSTDNSYEIALPFAKNNRVRVIRLSKNSGYSKAKNDAICISKGDYITCLDADDMFTKDSIRVRLDAMREHHVELVHANAVDVHDDVTLKECYQLNRNVARTRCRVHAQTVMVTRDVYKLYGLYDENLRSRADKEMWLRLLGPKEKNKAKIKAIKIKDDVAFYRKHDKSMMAFRRANPEYQKKVGRKLEEAIKMRQTEGIWSSNTRLLDR